MPPFHFRLEQVLQYRRQREAQAMLALARAIMRRDALRKRVADLERDIAAQRERLCRADTLEAAERWLTQCYVNALMDDAQRSKRDLPGAEEAVDQCRAVLVEKAKERGLLAKLKEKQAARHDMLERQQEQRINDETATLCYTPAAV